MPVTQSKYTSVKNNRPGPTVFSQGTDIVIEWAGSGDPMGEDIQAVPTELLDSPQFSRSLKKRVFTVVEEDSPEMVASRRLQEEALDAKALAEDSALDGILQPSAQDNDIVVVPCLISGQPVNLKASDVGVVPPLAEEHKDQAYLFSTQETGDPKNPTQWVKASIG